MATAKSASKKKRPARKSPVGANEKKWGSPTHKQGWAYTPNILLEHQAELEITPTELNVILTVMKHWWVCDVSPYRTT